ncbi:MAG: 50S ribosomal protein L15 [Treponema sp.]|jgi:large subunit ribosomal protein L15|nr:50S ribosomal protein L15 [Treponema sp.]
MQDFNLHAPAGANKKKRIIGRGQGSGRGTTAGKGNKGQQARSGGKTYVGFEGGQMPLYRRLAHRGFSNYPFKTEYRVINLKQIEVSFADGETVSPATLAAKGLSKGSCPVKILAVGELSKKLIFEVEKVSAAARGKIEKAGGTVTEKPKSGKPVKASGKAKKAASGKKEQE